MHEFPKINDEDRKLVLDWFEDELKDLQEKLAEAISVIQVEEYCSRISYVSYVIRQIKKVENQ